MTFTIFIVLSVQQKCTADAAIRAGRVSLRLHDWAYRPRLLSSYLLRNMIAPVGQAPMHVPLAKASASSRIVAAGTPVRFSA
jgi:hypothetical protein